MRALRIAQLLLFQATLLCSFIGYGQEFQNEKVVFSVDQENASCFDPIGGNKVMASSDNCPVYSVLPNKEALVYAELSDDNLKSKLLEFRISGSNESDIKKLTSVFSNGNRFKITLPPREENYTVFVFYKGKEIAKMEVRVYPERTEEVIVVPIASGKIDKAQLESYLGSVFKATNVRFNVTIDSMFDPSFYKTLSKFNSPTLEYKQYTHQMQEIRDFYFEQFPNHAQNARYIFVIPEFNTPQIKEYAVKGKSIGFVAYQGDSALFFRSFARTMAIGFGHLNVQMNVGSIHNASSNLMDASDGVSLHAWQWDMIVSQVSSFSYFDDYEHVSTDNGRVAYCFWEEDESGNIRIWDNDAISSLRRPYKQNFQSYHLNINDFLFRPLWTIWNRRICWWHLIFIFTSISLAALLKRMLDAQIEKRFARHAFYKLIARLIGLGLGFGIVYLGFNYIESKYKTFQVKEGEIKELRGMTEFQAVREINRNIHLQRKNENELCAELFIHRKNKWLKSKHKRVLYFEAIKEKNTLQSLRFTHSSDTLSIFQQKIKELAKSHYLVFTFRSPNGQTISQKVYTFKGKDITHQLKLTDPAKRIVLFVNGYRSVANDDDFNTLLNNVQSKGFELPSSTNLIYSFDRFEYWHEFDKEMIERINPAESYYADGNFSIETSDYRSIEKFAWVAKWYPKRCKDPNHHICYNLKKTAKWANFIFADQSESLLYLPSNKMGFQKRYRNGQIAGRNMFQMLNEIPNNSKNDTLYIACHSMGYAYALGMIKELRGKINFGGFYIIAPENAEAGKVFVKEWPEVWQYGANFNKGEADAPCLQDGIAPQMAAKGLDENHRVYIPKEFYKRRGFKDSHYIGLYKFLFTISPGKKGAIQQH
ncbi:MAG: hypothetical protein RL632_136 [Bacteroidota bacterium]|jgi:hypothetical protein